MVGEELLKLLANDTRMQILQVLWANFSFDRYVVREQQSTPFSELLRGTDIEDSGNLNYHLGKLTETVLTKRDDGYVLTPLGYNVMRSITTYASFDYRTVDPTELEEPCPFCGGTLLAAYERELVHTYCRNCEGLADGDINYVNLPAIDVNRRDLEGILDAATMELMTRVRSVTYGFCGQCHGRVKSTVTLCDSHESNSGRVCESCENRFGGRIEFSCHHCGAGGSGPLIEYAIVSPRIEAFFESQNRGPRGVGPFRYRLTCLEAASESLEVDPVTITYTFSTETETEQIQLAEDGGKLTAAVGIELQGS